MDIKKLLARLDQQKGSFSDALVAEVLARREGVTARFLEIFRGHQPEPGMWLADDGRMIHIYARYGLALFREVRAHALLVRIFSRPVEHPFALAGDVVTHGPWQNPGVGFSAPACGFGSPPTSNGSQCITTAREGIQPAKSPRVQTCALTQLIPNKII